MPSSGDPGRSWRTPLKHSIMYDLAAHESGALNSSAPVYRSISRLVWYDLTAGDAAPVDDAEWTRGCSAGILSHHASLSAKPVLLYLHENAQDTYARLLQNLEYRLPDLGYSRFDEATWSLPNGGGVRASIEPGQEANLKWVRGDAAVLVFNDPNGITDWAMRPGFVKEAADKGAWCLRTLSTLGCNPGGLKRLEKEKRQLWYDFPEEVRSGTPNYRDMVLAAIDRDEAQWAYLVSTSVKWRPGTEKSFRRAATGIDRTLTMSWAKTQPQEFQALTDRLFKTREERGER